MLDISCTRNLGIFYSDQNFKNRNPCWLLIFIIRFSLFQSFLRSPSEKLGEKAEEIMVSVPPRPEHKELGHRNTSGRWLKEVSATHSLPIRNRQRVIDEELPPRRRMKPVAMHSINSLSRPLDHLVSTAAATLWGCPWLWGAWFTWLEEGKSVVVGQRSQLTSPSMGSDCRGGFRP